jgi:hypothetical protein
VIAAGKRFHDNVVAHLNGEAERLTAINAEQAGVVGKLVVELRAYGPLTDGMHAAIIQAAVRTLGGFDFGSAIIGTLKRRGYIVRIENHEQAEEMCRPVRSYVLTTQGLAYFHAALATPDTRLIAERSRS